MTFSEAVSDGFSKYAIFQGRSSRAAYWWWFLFAVIVGIVTGLVDVFAKTGSVVSLIVNLALLLPSLAVFVRRLHDTGRSGWWVFIDLVPIIGWIVTLVFTLQRSKPPNRWGDAPDTATT